METVLIVLFALALSIYILASYLQHQARWTSHKRLGKEWPAPTFRTQMAGDSQVPTRSKEHVLNQAEGQEGTWGDEGRSGQDEGVAAYKEGSGTTAQLLRGSDEGDIFAAKAANIGEEVLQGIVWAEIVGKPGGHRITKFKEK